MMVTTLNRIFAADLSYQVPSTGNSIKGWRTLLNSLGKDAPDDEPLPFVVILKSNGVEDALWCLRTTVEYDTQARLFAAWCASYHLPLLQDPRCLVALETTKEFAIGEASKKKLESSRNMMLELLSCKKLYDTNRKAWQAAKAVWHATSPLADIAAVSSFTVVETLCEDSLSREQFNSEATAKFLELTS